MSEIVITEFMDAAAIELLQQHHTVHYAPDLFEREADLHALLQNAAALIVRNRTQVSAGLLGSAPQLRAVGRLGVGLDNIDQDACRARNIAVLPATGANAAAVAEYVLAMIFITLRKAYDRSAEVAAGDWPRSQASGGNEAGGKTLGLVGFGDIGRRVAKLAQAIGMRVLAYDPALPADSEVWQIHAVEAVALPALLARADVVSLHIPLLPATRGLIGREAIAGMKRGAILINSARGHIVDEAALADALRAGQLGGAAIDVFADEPLAAGSPLAGLPNVWLTPHVAGLTVESNSRVSLLVAERVLATLGH